MKNIFIFLYGPMNSWILISFRFANDVQKCVVCLVAHNNITYDKAVTKFKVVWIYVAALRKWDWLLWPWSLILNRISADADGNRSSSMTSAWEMSLGRGTAYHIELPNKYWRIWFEEPRLYIGQRSWLMWPVTFANKNRHINHLGLSHGTNLHILL